MPQCLHPAIGPAVAGAGRPAAALSGRARG